MEIIFKHLSSCEKKYFNSLFKKNKTCMCREQLIIESTKQGLTISQRLVVNTVENGRSCAECGISVNYKPSVFCKRCDLIICQKCFQENSELHSKICHKIIWGNKSYQWPHEFTAISFRNVYVVGDDLVSSLEERKVVEVSESEKENALLTKCVENIWNKVDLEQTKFAKDQEVGKILIKMFYNKQYGNLRINIANVEYPLNLKKWNVFVFLLPDVDNSTKIKLNSKNISEQTIEYRIAKSRLNLLSIFVQIVHKPRWKKGIVYFVEIHMAMSNNAENWFPLKKALILKPKSQFPLRLHLSISVEDKNLLITAKYLFGLRTSKSIQYKILLYEVNGVFRTANGFIIEPEKKLLGRKWLIVNEKYKFGSYVLYDQFCATILMINGGSLTISEDLVELKKPLEMHQMILKSNNVSTIEEALTRKESVDIILFLKNRIS